MLTIINITSIDDKKNLLKAFNPDNSLWVTSDIKSQNFILQQLENINNNTNTNTNNSTSTSTSTNTNTNTNTSNNTNNRSSTNPGFRSIPVQRAKKLWSFLFSTSHPNTKTIPRGFLVFIYQLWSENKKPWQKGIATGKLLAQYMDILAHLLQHPLKDSLVEEWVTSSKKSKYWLKWYELAKNFWNYLEKNNLIEESWISALLLDNIPFQQLKYEEIVFDLGFDIDTVQATLIQQISSKIKTTILVPKNKKDIYSAYHFFSQKKQPPAHHKSLTQNNSIKLRKFTSPIGEIKDITNAVKNKIQNGVLPHKIYVLAPHIEDYWTCLKSHLKRENIPVNKKEVAFLFQFPATQYLLAKLWAHLSVINYDHLENIYTLEKPHTNFSQLKADFYKASQKEEWPSEIFDLDKMKNKDDKTNALSFITWVKLFIPKQNKDQNISNFLNDFSKTVTKFKNLKLSWRAWLNLLESSLQKKESSIKKEETKGINCLSFNALNWVDADFIYIAALSEQNLKTEKHNLISSLESKNIEDHLGFLIKYSPVNNQEQMISSFIDQYQKDLILSYSATDFFSTPLNPSYIWLEKALEKKQDISSFNTPGTTTWDQWQKQNSVKDILNSRPDWKIVEQSIKEDLGYKEPSVFFTKQVSRLSTSSLNDYIKCPFIFAAKKAFQLWDSPQRDVDTPITKKGLIVHKLFETIKSLNKDVISKDEILEIIENISNQHLDKKPHPTIWEKEKLWFLKKAASFLETEKKQKDILKNYNVDYCEKKYECDWSFNKKSLVKKNQGDIHFTGKIDRIDSNNQYYHLIDYKATTPTGAIATNWAKHKNFQLAIYAQALEYGLTGLSPLPVKSALYLSYKNFEYKGMAIKEPEYIQLLEGDRKRSLISKEKKTKIFIEANEVINSIISNIYKGYFNPKPKKKTTCVNCRWRKICRAHHLN